MIKIYDRLSKIYDIITVGFRDETWYEKIIFLSSDKFGTIINFILLLYIQWQTKLLATLIFFSFGVNSFGVSYEHINYSIRYLSIILYIGSPPLTC